MFLDAELQPEIFEVSNQQAKYGLYDYVSRTFISYTTKSGVSQMFVEGKMLEVRHVWVI